jgi:hypothetical protein
MLRLPVASEKDWQPKSFARATIIATLLQCSKTCVSGDFAGQPVKIHRAGYLTTTTHHTDERSRL